MGEPSPKQAAFLTKNGQPVPATSQEASAAIAKIYEAKGIPQRERPAYQGRTYNSGYGQRSGSGTNNFADRPPTDKMIGALKKADWYTEGMLSGEARKRLDILASNNWRRPENVSGPDTLDSDLTY